MLGLQIGDLSSAQAQIDHLISARPPEKGELGFFTASLTRGRIMAARGEYQEARENLAKALEYFHVHGLYYYEAQASMAIALCDSHLQNERGMLDRLRRVVDLAVRYDYEYWLKRKIAKYPEIFSGEDALELLPLDLREQVSASPSPARTRGQVSEIALAAQPVTDLTVNMLGPLLSCAIPRDRWRRTPGPRDAPATFCASSSRAGITELRKTPSLIRSGAKPIWTW